MSRKYLKYEELLELINEGLSDIESLSDEDDGWEIDLPEGRDIGYEMSDVEETLEANSHVKNESETVKVTTVREHTDTLEQNEIVHVAKKKKISKEAKNVFYENNDLTPPTKIVWRKNSKYISPKIRWYTPVSRVVTKVESPLFFLKKYFTQELFHLMVDKTNLFAVQQQARFTPTSQNELEVFVGVHILMGNLQYPRIKCYWENKLRIPTIADSIPRDRFHKLRTFLHFVNVEEKSIECKNRFWKIRPLYDTIRKRMLELPLEAKLCIDEQMVPFKGRLNVKQYVKNKPTPWGIKIYALCGASSVMFDFVIYQGATREFNPEQVEIFGVGASVVLKHSERIHEKNVQLYFDNFFSNYNLLQYLRHIYIYASGTARVDRFAKPPFSSDAEMKKAGRGTSEEVLSEDGEVILTKWFDNRSVIMASNFMSVGNTEVCKRWDKRTKQYVEVPRPEVVKNYNTNMGGVDKMDFLITIYRTKIRSRKWTLRMFTHSIDLACANAWLEYRAKSEAFGVRKKDILDLLHFRTYISEGLIGADKSTTQRTRGRPPKDSPLSSPSTSRQQVEITPIPEIRLDGPNHIPVFDDKSFASRCKRVSCRRRTHIQCEKCRVHLCIGKKQNCFAVFHTKK